MGITYQNESSLSAMEFLEVLEASGLAERRPVDELDRIEGMVANATLIVTARDGGKLVGVARSVTDFTYCCYLSDLAVAKSHQHQGIGTGLIRFTQDQLHPKATVILLSAPKAVDYYPKVGFQLHPAAYIKRRTG